MTAAFDAMVEDAVKAREGREAAGGAANGGDGGKMNGIDDDRVASDFADHAHVADIDAADPVLNDTPPLVLKAFSAANFKDREVPERRWIVPNYIPDGTPTLLSGDGGTGKSWIALQLAAARALARDWLALMPEPGSTLLLSAEGDEDEIHRRLDSILRFYAKQSPATWDDLADIRLVDLVGQDSILGLLKHGIIEPTEMYKALDVYMGDFKPGLVVLDVLADLFAGQERERNQTRQFANLLHGLCHRHHCGLLLLAHPSLAGMNTGTGLSGSTDWNNAFRSRLYFSTPKTDKGAEINKNLRILEGKKNNRGEIGGPIEVEFKDGLFVPINIPGGLGKLASEARADGIFIDLIAKTNSEGREVSSKPSASYAPAEFVKRPDRGGLSKNELEDAMNRLFAAKKIRAETHGAPSRLRTRIVVADETAEE
jgi:hypothetical protein